MLDPREGIAPDGTIVTGIARSRVAAEFEPVITAAKAALPNRDEVSLYLYGSVATGQAKIGYSDVDLLTVGLEPAAARRLGKQLSVQFAGLCREVAVAPIAVVSSLCDRGDPAYGDRVFLRHYCLHLSGSDHARGWPAFPADVRAARGFNGDLAQHADRWRAAVDSGEQPRKIGRALARKTLLAIAGLVSVHERLWTTDRSTAARRWGKLHPELARDLDGWLDWSQTRDLPDANQIRRSLDGPIAATVSTFASTIGLWPPDR